MIETKLAINGIKSRVLFKDECYNEAAAERRYVV